MCQFANKNFQNTFTKMLKIRTHFRNSEHFKENTEHYERITIIVKTFLHNNLENIHIHLATLHFNQCKYL